MNRTQIGVTAAVFGAFFIGLGAGIVVPRPVPDPVMVEVEKVVETVVEKEVTIAEQGPTIYLEREPTVHPTDCLVMRWLHGS